MEAVLLPLLILAASYLVGSIPFSFLVGKLWGIDIRKTGSGNIGTANVMRSAGKPAGILAGILDMGKGIIVISLIRLILPDMPEDLILGAGIMVVLGHIYPVYLKFKGGKGVATSAGVMLILCPAALLSAVCVYVLGVTASRGISSVGSLAGALSFPLFVTVYKFFAPDVYAFPFNLSYPHLMAAAAILVGIIFLKHTSNIKRLLAGKELKV